MINKKVIMTLAVVAMIALAGCDHGGKAPGGKGVAEGTGEDVSGVNVGSTYMYEIKITEKNQRQLVEKRPPFVMKDSLERQNLINRYEYLNDRNNQHHVYMVSHDGKVISYSVAQGKVSSVNSKLTNDKQIVARPRCVKHVGNNGESGCYKTVESPQMDGSYGTNGNAIFWFTPDGQYKEWNGIYLVSEEPQNIQTPISLVDRVGNETGS